MQSDVGASLVRGGQCLSAFSLNKEITADTSIIFASRVHTEKAIFSVGDVVAIDSGIDSTNLVHVEVSRIFRVGTSMDFCFSYYPIEFFRGVSLYQRRGTLVGEYKEGGNDVGNYRLFQTGTVTTACPRLYSVLRVVKVLKGVMTYDSFMRSACSKRK